MLEQLKRMPESERGSLFASLIENEKWREDLLDLMTLAERRGEPTRSIDEVFKDSKIDA
jgi:hypothetical protein